MLKCLGFTTALLERLQLGHSRNRLRVLRRDYARDSITTRLFSSNNSKSRALHYKRLIICCDGTWQSSHDTASNPTNVTQFSRAVQVAQQQKDGTEIQQVVLYQPGLGTGAMGRIRSHIAGGLAFGLNENVTEAYMFLANNFEIGDEIFLFGYSRGAYTARAVAGLISSIGLLKKASLHEFQGMYHLYQKRSNESVEWETYLKDKLHKSRHWDRQTEVKIKVIGCWDTVGSLGFPETPFGEWLGWNDKHKFHDTELSPIIENAFHCLALEERRRSFAPALWHIPQEEDRETIREIKINNMTQSIRREKPPTLRQIWLPGVHADVGGHTPFAKIALAWMIHQCHNLLIFDDHYMCALFDSLSDCAPYPITDSMKGIFRLHGSTYRTPGEYWANKSINSMTWNDTNEMVHPLVWDRMVKYPEWRPPSLTGFKRVPVEGELNQFKWVKAVSKGGSERVIELPEYKIMTGSLEDQVSQKMVAVGGPINSETIWA